MKSVFVFLIILNFNCFFLPFIVVGIGTTGNFKIVPLELSKQNEDQKFLMSLLPEFESIPDGYKIILKNDIINLVHSTKLRANNRKLEGY